MVLDKSPEKHRKGSKDTARHEEPLELGLRTPKTPLQLPAGWLNAPEATPKTPKSNILATPKIKKEVAGTPPSGPAMLQKRLRDDIEVALLTRSVPLLSLALLRSHCCGENHSVHEAVRRQNFKVLSFILQSQSATQADVHCQGRRPLHGAIQQCMSKDDVGYKMLEALLAVGACPDFCEGDEPSLGAPLHMAAKRGCFAVVALLLSYGADVNIRDANNHTPLHMVCRHVTFQPGYAEEKVAGLLLSHGASPVAIDSLGHMPGDYAHDVSLSCMLQRAAQWWARQQLALAVGGRDLGESRGLAGERVQVPWLLPEIFGAIADCL
jgi:hypothetical protein